MAIAATATTDYTVDQILRLALVNAGVLNPRQFNSNHEGILADLAVGRMQLFVELQALQNDGILIRARERRTLTLTASQAYVDAPADALSVEKGGTVRTSDSTPTDLPMEVYTANEYQQIPVKTTEGKPNFYYAEKQPATESWRIYLYPVPTTDYPSITVPITRRLRDVELGSVHLDLAPKHYLHVLKTMGSFFAGFKGRVGRGTALAEQAVVERQRAEDDETPRGDTDLVVAPTPWD